MTKEQTPDDLFAAAAASIEANLAPNSEPGNVATEIDKAAETQKAADAAAAAEEEKKVPAAADPALAEKAAAVEREAKAAAATKAADDELAALPEATRAIVERIRADAEAKIVEANTRATRHASQVAGYEAKLKEARAAVAAASSVGDAQAKAKAKAKEAEVTDALAKVKADFPPIGDAIDLVRKELTESIRRELGLEVANLRNVVAPLVSTHASSLEAAEDAAISAAHKDWKQTVETPEFKTWWGKQPAGVQALAKGDAADEIALFDLFRTAHPAQATSDAEQSEAAKLAAKRAQQLKDAAGPSGKRTQSPGLDTGTEDNAVALFNKAAAQIAKEMNLT